MKSKLIHRMVEPQRSRRSYNLWDQLVREFVCTKCGVEVGKGCLSARGKPVEDHSARRHEAHRELDAAYLRYGPVGMERLEERITALERTVLGERSF